MPNIVSSKLFDHTDTTQVPRLVIQGRCIRRVCLTIFLSLEIPRLGKSIMTRFAKIFHRLGVPDSHHLGRDRLCERYSGMLHKIHNDAGNAAVERWLEQYKDETNAGIQQ